MADGISHHEDRQYESEENLFEDSHEHPSLHSLLKEAEDTHEETEAHHHTSRFEAGPATFEVEDF